MMFPALPVGRLFGIGVFIHWTFWLLPLWVALRSLAVPEDGSLAMHLALLAAMFGCVVLHEYGHALTARRFGIGTHDITLYPIGGVARLERMSERPWEEFCISVAGPLVNVVIAAVLGAGLLAAWLFVPALLPSVVIKFVVLLTGLNVMLVLFNLVPAFPMDGGRVLRAILAAHVGYLRATRIATTVGTAIALTVGPVAALAATSPSLLLISVFVVWAGAMELSALEARERQRLEDEIPVVIPVDELPRGWSVPPSTVTIYVWDGGRSQWVRQGAAPARRGDWS